MAPAATAPAPVVPEQTVTEPPPPPSPDTVTAPAPILDARARLMASLADQARRGVKVINTFDELKSLNASKFPPRWPALLDGRKIVGLYQYCGKNGEGLAGNPLLSAEVWKPLSREYCAGHAELKHITNGFNAEGLYQHEDSIFGYCDEETYKAYNEAVSYNKPTQIMLREMQRKFETANGTTVTEKMEVPGDARNAILQTEFATSMVDESVANQLAQMGGRGKRAAAAA